MEKSKTSNRYSPEMRTRTVRMVLEHQGSYETQGAAVTAIAPKIGCIPETLKVWVRARILSTRLRRISAANIGPNLFHQNRTVSWLTSIPRSCRRSSTLRSDNGNLM